MVKDWRTLKTAGRYAWAKMGAWYWEVAQPGLISLMSLLLEQVARRKRSTGKNDLRLLDGCV